MSSFSLLMKKAKTAMATIIGTHNGSFHADEALACFLLRQTNDYKDSKIVRTRDLEVLKTLDIVVDVGGEYDYERKRFDHHQKGFFETFSPKFSTKLSSAGLIYKHFGEEVISNLLQIERNNPHVPEIYNKVYVDFVEAFDGIDNGIDQYETNIPPKYTDHTNLSARVGRLNPAWNETGVDIQAQFEKAVSLTGSEFVDRVQFIWNSWLPAREIVVKALKTRFEVDKSGLVLLLEQAAPWKEHLFNLEEQEKIEEKPLYILFPDQGKEWRIQCIPLHLGTFENRLRLPIEWGGLANEKLSEVAQIEGCVFCHASGFIGGIKLLKVYLKWPKNQ